MIQDCGKHASRFSLLSFETTSNGTEDLISSIGYQNVGPRQEYPARVIPKRYSFNDGRQLAEFQLVYITGGTGVFEDNESSRIVTPGTLFLLRPGYWHSYHPNRDTGWTEYYIGFNGPTFRREIERFSVKGKARWIWECLPPLWTFSNRLSSIRNANALRRCRFCRLSCSTCLHW